MVDTLSQKILLVIGLVVLAGAFRSFGLGMLRKLALLLIFGASYVAAFFVFRHHLAGVTAILAWFFLPWIELLTRIRKIRLPLEKKLESVAPPGPQRFPTLHELTEEVEAAGFEHANDAGWEWDGLEQFFRIFYHEEKRQLVTLCLNEQNEMGFVHVAITCRDAAGGIWRTWDYPFSHSLAQSPNLKLNQIDPGLTFQEMWERHESFLEDQAILGTEELQQEDPEMVTHVIEQEVAGQIDHNLSRGIIRVSDQGTFCYSFRGLLFLWAQSIKDMLKLF